MCAVDQPDPCGQRVDPEPLPGEVEEGQGRHDGDVDPLVRSQQLNGPLATSGEPKA